jgi:hypothetical protein
VVFPGAVQVCRSPRICHPGPVDVKLKESYALHAGPPVFTLSLSYRLLFALAREPAPVIDLLALAVRLCYTSGR